MSQKSTFRGCSHWNSIGITMDLRARVCLAKGGARFPRSGNQNRGLRRAGGGCPFLLWKTTPPPLGNSDFGILGFAPSCGLAGGRAGGGRPPQESRAGAVTEPPPSDRADIYLEDARCGSAGEMISRSSPFRRGAFGPPKNPKRRPSAARKCLLFGKKTGPGNRRFPQETIGWGQFEPPREGKKIGFWVSQKAGSPGEIGPPRASQSPQLRPGGGGGLAEFY